MGFVFSRRTNSWTHKLNALEEALNLVGKDTGIADLTQSNPTRAGFVYPRPWLDALSQPDAMRYDPVSLGLPLARQAVSDYYARRGIGIDPQHIVLTSSSSESYGHLLRLLVNPHEKVLIPVPSYPLFPYLLDIHDVAYSAYRLTYEKGWAIDREHFLKQMDATVKAVMVVHPNNPTGSYVSADDASWLLDVAQEHRLALIVDEVFMDYALTQGASSFCGTSRVLTFVLGGCSKTLGLPQMKVGWIIPSGPPDLVQGALQRLEIIADTYLSVNIPAQLALPTWLSSVEDIQSQILKRLRQNLSVAESKGFPKPLFPQAGWSLIAMLPDDRDDEAFCLKALREGVCVYPGYYFDMPQDHFIVASLLTETAVFKRGWTLLQQILS